jgi:hypothetical protein
MLEVGLKRLQTVNSLPKFEQLTFDAVPRVFIVQPILEPFHSIRSNLRGLLQGHPAFRFGSFILCFG